MKLLRNRVAYELGNAAGFAAENQSVAVGEDPRQGEDPADCNACRAVPDEREVYRDGLWRVFALRATPFPGTCMLQPLRHAVGVNGLNAEELASYGPMVARITDALEGSTGFRGARTARVHSHLWNDGGAHLHQWFFPRPYGYADLLGSTLDTLGVTIAFTKVAVVLAVVFVAGPFYLRPAIAAFEGVNTDLRDAARTLGAGQWRTFSRVALPLAGGGLAAGAALSFARGIGEFGATIMFAGSLQGVTQTLSLAIYEQFDVDFDTAIAIGVELVAVSALLLLTVKLVPGWRRSTSLFPIGSARTGSS